MRTEVQPVQFTVETAVPRPEGQAIPTEVLSPLAHDAFLWNLDAACSKRSISPAMCSRIWLRTCWRVTRGSSWPMTKRDNATLSGVNRHARRCNGFMSGVRISKERPTDTQCTELWTKEIDPPKTCIRPTHLQTHRFLKIGDRNPHGWRVPTMRQGCFAETLLKPRRNRFGMPSKWHRA